MACSSDKVMPGSGFRRGKSANGAQVLWYCTSSGVLLLYREGRAGFEPTFPKRDLYLTRGAAHRTGEVTSNSGALSFWTTGHSATLWPLTFRVKLPTAMHGRLGVSFAFLAAVLWQPHSQSALESFPGLLEHFCIALLFEFRRIQQGFQFIRWNY